MRLWGRAALVPLIALVLWLVPSDDPTLETAEAASAALADSPSDPPSPDDIERSSPTAGATTTTTFQASAEALAVSATSSSTTTTTTTVPTTIEQAPTTVAPSPEASSTTEQTTTTEPLSIGDQALLRMSYPWRTTFPEWRVVFRGPRSGIRALTYPQEKRIEIFVRSSDTVSSLHRVFAHELGHVVDVEFNSEADRERWRQQRGIAASAPWWPNAEAPDFATGAGDFAEAFAVWETGVTTRSTVAGQPTGDDLALLVELSRG